MKNMKSLVALAAALALSTVSGVPAHGQVRSQLPDLVAIKAVSNFGGLRITVKNQGTATAGPTVMRVIRRFSPAPELTWLVDTPRIAPGATAEVMVTPLYIQYFELEACVDFFNAVVESNERNCSSSFGQEYIH